MFASFVCFFSDLLCFFLVCSFRDFDTSVKHRRPGPYKHPCTLFVCPPLIELTHSTHPHRLWVFMHLWSCVCACLLCVCVFFVHVRILLGRAHACVPTRMVHAYVFYGCGVIVGTLGLNLIQYTSYLLTYLILNNFLRWSILDFDEFERSWLSLQYWKYIIYIFII